MEVRSQGLSVLKKNTGAQKVGTESGANVRYELNRIDNELAGVGLEISQLNNAVATEFVNDAANFNAVIAHIESEAGSLRAGLPFYRLSENQGLMGVNGSVPDGWLSHPDCTFTLLQSVWSSKYWVDRTEEEKELLIAMGREGSSNFYKSFNIWRMDWVGSGIHTMYQRCSSSSDVTIAAMTKVLSGSIGDNWALGANSEWGLTGKHVSKNNLGYTQGHPVTLSESGSVLFALPAVVVGKVPLDQNYWGDFPYIGDSKND